MTIGSLKRVMLRLRKMVTLGQGDNYYATRSQLQKAIYIECGTSPATYFNNRRALINIGWLKTIKKRFLLTDLDLTEDFDYG